MGDLLYKRTNHNLWAKKFWIYFVGVVGGVKLLIIGKLDPHDLDSMIGLIALLAISLEAGNGVNFAFALHVLPHTSDKPFSPSSITNIYANGSESILSGLVGASGNPAALSTLLSSGTTASLRARFLDHGHTLHCSQPCFRLGYVSS